MIILNTIATDQGISIIPRSYVSEFTMLVRDESTNVEVTYNITNALNEGNYLTFLNSFNPILVENHFYDLKIVDDDGEVIYRDRIFCTDQDLDQLINNQYYELNEGQYTFYNGYDNTYKVR
jgi:hypothetical protein